MSVSYAKPKTTGGIYVAPVGTTLPTDATTALAAGFTALGYVSEDGTTNSNEIDSGDIKAWGGDTVLSFESGHSDTFKFVLIDATSLDVLKTVYGSSNVTGVLSTGVTVKVNNDSHGYFSWAIEMILADGTLKRISIPEAKIITLGDIVYVDDEPIGYDLTIKARPDSSGQTHYEYLYKAS